MICSKFIIDKSVINDELETLNNILEQQRTLKKTLLLYLEKISEGISNATDKHDSTSLISCLDTIKKSFENIRENINKLTELKNYLLNSLKSDCFNPSYFEKYNKDFKTIFNKISEDNIFYYTFMESILKYMNVKFPEISPVVYGQNFGVSKNINFSNEANNSSNTEPFNNNLNLKENVLLVSEKEKNVVLPYSTIELEIFFADHPEKYSSIKDIVDKEYTLPLNYYKHAAISRFKEAFYLARKKSKLSFAKSLSLANELFFNSNLNPAIITACRNVDELYIYLSCLDDNALDKFNCFRIVYDTM